MKQGELVYIVSMGRFVGLLHRLDVLLEQVPAGDLGDAIGMVKPSRVGKSGFGTHSGC